MLCMSGLVEKTILRLQLLFFFAQIKRGGQFNIVSTCRGGVCGVWEWMLSALCMLSSVLVKSFNISV